MHACIDMCMDVTVYVGGELSGSFDESEEREAELARWRETNFYTGSTTLFVLQSIFVSPSLYSFVLEFLSVHLLPLISFSLYLFPSLSFVCLCILFSIRQPRRNAGERERCVCDVFLM